MSGTEEQGPVPASRSAPEYGPAGYLPERAARRARKVILRGRMGLGWPLAAVAAGTLVLVAGVAFLLTRTAPPGPPYAPLVAIDDVDPRAASVVPGAGREFVVVRAGGGVRVFRAPGPAVAYCPVSRRLEAADGTVWALSGRVVGGPGGSLAPVPAQVFRGTLYVDPARQLPPPSPQPGDAAPACTGQSP